MQLIFKNFLDAKSSPPCMSYKHLYFFGNQVLISCNNQYYFGFVLKILYMVCRDFDRYDLHCINYKFFLKGLRLIVDLAFFDLLSLFSSEI